MSRISRIAQVALFLTLFMGGFAVAQTVDPCQFGCPKEGCPQCGSTGGPLPVAPGN